MLVSAQPEWRVAASVGSHLSCKAAVNLHTDGTLSDVQSRQLESLIRLTEARAKLDLREVATKDDAEVGFSCQALATPLIFYTLFQQWVPHILLLSRVAWQHVSSIPLWCVLASASQLL